jgi:hypothetical protein
MKRILVQAIFLGSTGCLFSAPNQADSGHGEEDMGVVDDTSVADTAQMDMPGSVEEDMSSPVDIGQQLIDLGASDATTADPYEIVQRIDLFADKTPRIDSPAQVSMFKDGFLAGFADVVSLRAYVGWFAEDTADPRDTREYSIGTPTFDLAGDSTRGYAVMQRPDTRIAVIFEEAPDTAETLSDVVEADTNTNPDSVLNEASVATEGEYAYTAEVRTLSGGHLDVWVISDGTYGYGTEHRNISLQGIEAIGGGATAPSRQLLAAGIDLPNLTYKLVDFQLKQDGWSNKVNACGAPPVGSARITPMYGKWVLAKLPALNGGTHWRLIECAQTSSDVRWANIFGLPTGREVMDFDVAEESVSLPMPAVAWIQQGEVYFGFLDIDPEEPSAEVVDVWKIPDAIGMHVRTAYNPGARTFAVVAQRDGAAELILLKRR